MPPLGFAEQGADQAVKQIDGLVGQAGGEVHTDRHQCRVAALAFIISDMLNRGAAGLTRQLRQPCLMDEMTSARLDTDATHFLQPLDHAQQRRGFGGFRHLPQPGQPRLAALVTALGQRIETLALVGGQSIGQPTVCFSACMMTKVGAEPFQRGGRRGNNTAFAANPHDQLGQVNEPVILDCLRQKLVGQSRHSMFAEGTKPEFLLTFDGVALAVPLLGDVFVDRCGKNVDLLSYKCQQSRWWSLANAHGATGISQIAAHKGIAETVVITPAAVDRCQVGFRQSVMADQFALFCRGIK
jgi:hypothetical protein